MHRKGSLHWLKQKLANTTHTHALFTWESAYKLSSDCVHAADVEF